MSRLSVFSSPLLLGFDELERMLDRASKTSGDGYPPYNIERLPRAEGEAERLRITPSPFHSDADIDHLVTALATLWQRCAISHAVA